MRGHFNQCYRNKADFKSTMYTNELETLDESGKFLETHYLPSVNHRETENLNRPITRKEVELVLKILPTRKSQAPDGFPEEFGKTSKEELAPITLRCFPTLRKWREHSQTHFPWPKLKALQKRKLQVNMPNEY